MSETSPEHKEITWQDVSARTYRPRTADQAHELYKEASRAANAASEQIDALQTYIEAAQAIKQDAERAKGELSGQMMGVYAVDLTNGSPRQ